MIKYYNNKLRETNNINECKFLCITDEQDYSEVVYNLENCSTRNCKGIMKKEGTYIWNEYSFEWKLKEDK